MTNLDERRTAKRGTRESQPEQNAPAACEMAAFGRLFGGRVRRVMQGIGWQLPAFHALEEPHLLFRGFFT